MFAMKSRKAVRPRLLSGPSVSQVKMVISEQYEAKQLTTVSIPQVSFSNFGLIQMQSAFLKVHCESHFPEKASILADKLVVMMKEELKANSLMSGGLTAN